MNCSPDYLLGLLKELRALPNETEWVEFKANYADPEEIGEYISALANGAALCGKTFAYLVWGVDNDAHDVVGTKFLPREAKKGNEEIENWLLRLLAPKLQFSFIELEQPAGMVVILEIECARREPVQFQGQEFVRIGSYKEKLKEFPERERALWRIFDRVPFERAIAVDNLTEGEALGRPPPVDE